MRIDIIAKNYKDSNRLSEIVEKKLQKLTKYFNEDAIAKVRLSMQKNDKFSMEITISQPGLPTFVRAESTSENMYDNIDILLPKLEKQIVKYRARFDKKKTINQDYVFEKAKSVPEYMNYGKIVKEKNFAISITTVEDAIAEMELLDHDFYVFVNAENNKVSVVYKRHDGDFGLITPEY